VPVIARTQDRTLEQGHECPLWPDVCAKRGTLSQQTCLLDLLDFGYLKDHRPAVRVVYRIGALYIGFRLVFFAL